MAGLIPQSFIDDLLNRTDIVEVVSSRIQLKKTGKNYSACCPFHKEKTPSFTVSPDKQFYYCFGCGAGGNALGFVGAVGDRPRPRRGLDGVEVAPHLVEHVLRHEVGVDVDEAGQTQTFGVRAHRGGFVVSARRGQVRHQARMPQPAGSVGEGGHPIARGHAREGQGVGIDEGRGRPDIGPREIRAHHGHRGEG